jgi:hypothetical protein
MRAARLEWAHINIWRTINWRAAALAAKASQSCRHTLTDQFQKAALQPAGVHGYAQPVEFNVLQLDESQSSLDFIPKWKSRTGTVR